MSAQIPSSTYRASTREQHLRNQLTSFKRLLIDVETVFADEKEALADAEQRAAQALRTELFAVEVQANGMLAEIYRAQIERLIHYQRSTAMYQKWWWPILVLLAFLFGSTLPGMALADLRDEQRRRDSLDHQERERHSHHQRLLSRLNYLQSRQHDPVTPEVRQAREQVASRRRLAETLRWHIQRLEVELDSLSSCSHP